MTITERILFMKERISTQKLVLIGMFAAVIAVMAQIQFPLPSGVPVTLQTFAIALAGYVLGWQSGLACIIVYILLGMVGVPVFSGFQSGLACVSGPTAGYIWGFLPMVALCGLGYKKENKALCVVFSLFGLFFCHLLGCFQLSHLAQLNIKAAFFLGSAPYLIKDLASLFIAAYVAKAIRHALSSQLALH